MVGRGPEGSYTATIAERISLTWSPSLSNALHSTPPYIVLECREQRLFSSHTPCEINADGSYSVMRLQGEHKGEIEKKGAHQIRLVKDY